MKVKKIWAPSGGYTIIVGRFPKIAYYGRQPFALSDEKHRKALIEVGSFSPAGEDKMFYSGDAFHPCETCGETRIDKDGFCEVDLDAAMAEDCTDCAQFIATETFDKKEDIKKIGGIFIEPPKVK